MIYTETVPEVGVVYTLLSRQRNFLVTAVNRTDSTIAVYPQIDGYGLMSMELFYQLVIKKDLIAELDYSRVKALKEKFSLAKNAKSTSHPLYLERDPTDD